MPYIKQADRDQYDQFLDQIKEIKTKGDLEYCIYKLMKIYAVTRTFNYTNLHDATYAASHCSDEFRRNFLDKREVTAMVENGDILPNFPVAEKSCCGCCSCKDDPTNIA
jgi:hypothetical protein